MWYKLNSRRKRDTVYFGKRKRVTASMILLVWLLELCIPPMSIALTSGPTSPDFAGFEPLGTTGMVNETTGTFTYSIPLIQIPGPDGSSYPLTLSYHSGVGVEDEASWVGYGWTLNPGSITRNLRGAPDDDNNQAVTYYNNIFEDETYTIGASLAAQAASYDVFKFEHAVSYNTRAGYSILSGLSLNVGNLVSMDLRLENGRTRYAVRPHWANLTSAVLTCLESKETKDIIADEKAEKLGINSTILSMYRSAMQESRSEGYEKNEGSIVGVTANFLTQSFYTSMSETNPAQFTGTDYTINFGATVAVPVIPVLVGGHGGVRGTYATKEAYSDPDQTGTPKIKLKSFGYMYQSNHVPNGEESSQQMMDYAIESEAPFTSRDRYLSPVFGLHDIFSITGQSIGGSFRLWQKRSGVYHPRSVASRKIQAKIDIELGASIDKITGGTKAIFGNDGTYVSSAVLNDAVSIGETLGMEASADPNGYEGFDRAKNSVFARMSNDPAGSVRYSNDDAPRADVVSEDNAFNDVYNRVNDYPTSYETPNASSLVTFRTELERAYRLASASRSALPTTEVGTLAYTRGKHAVIHSNPYGEVTRVPPTLMSLQDQSRIGEFTSVTPNGMTYVYGLPVLSRGEKTLQYMGPRVQRAYKNHMTHVHDAALKLNPTGDDVDVPVVGYDRPGMYANSYLLTNIFTPDYVDRTSDGPSRDDLGGWVAFEYRQAAGLDFNNMGEHNWYRWRIPYSGFRYSEGQHTSPHDDIAAVSMGYREVKYLHRVDTKSHVAVFVTNKTDVTIGGKRFKGSLKERMDAWEAFNDGGGHDVCEKKSAEWQGFHFLPAVEDKPYTEFEGLRLGSRQSPFNPWDKLELEHALDRKNKSEYLEKVVLVAKNSDGTLGEVVQVVNLEYDYSLQQYNGGLLKIDTKWNPVTGMSEPIVNPLLWDTNYAIPGMLNASLEFTNQGVDDDHVGKRTNMRRHGKLTLKRVWTDFGDVREANISPYEFDYQYPQEGADPPQLVGDAALDAQYAEVAKYKPNSTPPDEQDGRVIENPPYEQYLTDPWGFYRFDGYVNASERRQHLEQAHNDGNWGDPAAWHLKVIHLPSGAEIRVQYETNTYSFVQDQPAMAFVRIADVAEVESVPIYELDLSSLPGTNRGEEISDRLVDYIRNQRKRIFYKFLAGVQRDAIPSTITSFPNDGAEYIACHSDVSENDVRLWDVGAVDHVGLAFDDEYTPQELAEEYALTHRLGYGTDIKTGDQTFSDAAVWINLLGNAAFVQNFAGMFADRFDGPFLDPIRKFSYVRVPCGSKRGGGVRVKRILMVDRGMVPGDGKATMHGTEYIYEMTQTVNGRTYTQSSGVTTTEPTPIRDESSLTTFLQGRDEPSILEELSSGDDMHQMEGPLCASAYPGPSIVYSRVVTRSIRHDLPTAPGFSIAEFNTAKDYPVRVEASEIDQFGIDIPMLPKIGGVLSVSLATTGASQGYSVVLNAMHGTPKSVVQYGGEFADPTTWRAVQTTTYEYYKPGQAVKVLKRDAQGAVKIEEEQLGVDMDFAGESRRVLYDREVAAVPFDAGMQIPFPPSLVFSVSMPSVQVSLNHLKTRVATKVISSSVMPYRTVTTRDGMVHVEENVAFNAATGKPCIVRSYDETYKNFIADGSDTRNNKALLSYSIPASLMYPSMGAKAYNDMVTVRIIYLHLESNYCVVDEAGAKYIEPGDIIRIGTYSNECDLVPQRFFYVVSKDGADVTLAEWSVSEHTWDPAYTTGTLYATVVRSGRTNQLDQIAGSILQFGEIDDNEPLTGLDNVIKANATVFDQFGSARYPALAEPEGTRTYCDYEIGLLGRWSPKSTHVWRADATSVFEYSLIATSERKRNYETGFSDALYTGFNYASPPTSTTAEWVRTTKVTKVDGSNRGTEELNPLSVPSTVKFAHADLLPSIIASNADAGSVTFLSFEEDGVADASAHTGKYVNGISTGTPELLATIETTAQLMDQGMAVRYWAKTHETTSPIAVKANGGTALPTTKIAKSGEWTLFEALMTPSQVGAQSPSIEITMNGTTAAAVVDDVRVQPAKAQTTSYVYDRTSMRLLAQFDDQHFALMYQYAPDGRLTYKKRETERGVVTISERQYNTPKTERVPSTPPEPMMYQGGVDVMNATRSAIRSGVGKIPQNGGVGAKGTVLDIQLSPDKRAFKLFDGQESSIDSLRQKVDSTLNRNQPK